MKKLIILLLSLLGASFVMSQVTGDNIDYVLFVQSVNYYDNGNEGSSPEPAWSFSTGTNSSANNIRTNVCITAPDETTHTVNKLIASEQNAPSNRRVYWEAEGWENDDTNSSRYCAYDTGDDEYHESSGSLTARYSSAAVLHSGSNVGMGSSEWRPRYYWTYHNGQWWVNGGLYFGVLEQGDDKSHSNSTIQGTFNNYTYGRKNTFQPGASNVFGAPAQQANDAYYRFDIADVPKRVDIGTSVASFNHYIHLMHKEDGVFTHVSSSNGINPNIVENLPPGIYYIVFEGEGTRNGNFAVHVAVSELPLESGSIAAEESNVCEGISLPFISSAIDVSGEVWGASGNTFAEPDRYFWEKRILGVTEWNNTGISNETSSTLDPVGLMVQDQNVAFRRRGVLDINTTEWVYDTVFFQPSTVTPGTIAYGFEDYVREDYLLQGDVTPSVNATGGPQPLTFRWEQQVPNATSFEVIDDEGAIYDNPILTAEVLGGLGEGFTNVRRVAVNGCGLEDISNEIIIKGRPADGTIEGNITAPPIGFGPGIKNVEVCATPLDLIYGITTVCDTTNLDGYYLLRDLYYDEDGLTRYQVKPKYLDHQIRISETSEDSTRTIELSSTTHNIQTSTNFVDLSVFTATGNVYQTFQEAGQSDVNYGKSKVVIYLENLQTGTEEIVDTTDVNGDYSIIIPNGGNWKITPRLVEDVDNSPHEHTFNPPSRTLLISESVVGIDFENTTTMNISGFVGASCDNYLGTTLLRFYQDPKDGTFDREFRTGLGSGLLDFTLPARDYLIEIVGDEIEDKDVASYNYAKVEDQFAGFQFSASLTHQDASFILNYKAPPTITIEGVPELPNCNEGSYNYPVLDKFKEYTDFKIRAWEGVSTNNCPLDTGYMDVVDGIGGRNGGRIPISDGVSDFVLIAGEPNIVEATDYLLTSNFVIGDFSNSETAGFDLSVLVTGGKPQQETFTTVSPQVPLLVLHDPPGDASYSYYTEETVSETKLTTFARKSGSFNKWIEGKLGTDIETSIGVGTELATRTKQWAIVEGGSTVDRIRDTTNSVSLRISNLSHINTSSAPILIGDAGDVFYGAAFNFIYALTDEVLFDIETCSVNTDTDFFISPDSIATTYVKTTRDIENDIAELTRLKELQTPDSMVYFQSRIDLWEQTLANNRARKLTIIENENPRFSETFGSGITIGNTVATTRDTFDSYEYLVEVDKEFAISAGIEIAGSGVQGGVYTRIRSQIGTDSMVNNSTTLISGFELRDDDEGTDQISVEIFDDSNAGTFVFKTVSEFTSCPYQDSTFLGVDQFVFTHKIDSEPIQTGVDPSIGASYKAILSNIGPFERTYYISNDASYNQDGAMVSLGGNVAGIPLQVVVPSNSSIEIPMTINKDPAVDVYSYRNIKINVDPICNVAGNGDISEDLSRQFLFLSATFIGNCSQMDITAPTDYTIVNNANQNDLSIRLQNYDITMLDRAVLQYRKMGSATWLSSAAIDLLSVDLEDGPSGTLLSWDLEEVVEEGLHEIRFKITCTTPGTTITNINYSNRVVLSIDRIGPQVFGIPLPIDDNYDVASNDEIGVTYNEDICTEGSTSANAIIVDLITGDTLETTVTCANNGIRIEEQGSSLNTRAPSVYRVILSGVTDLAGNQANDYKWIFTVGNFTPVELGCIADLLVTNNNENQDAINVANYNAISIISSGVISGFGETRYSAQESISLEDGFEISSGGAFIANIETCEDN